MSEHTVTNLAELKIHLNSVFTNLLKTDSIKTGGKEAGRAMVNKVQAKMGSTQHDYLQTGEMKRLIREEAPVVQANKTGSKLNIGVGDIDEWNIETRRGPQRGTFEINGVPTQIGLRPEPDLPAWIIMEFGRRAGSGVSSAGIPKDFLVPYSSREPKDGMFGPSTSRHFNKTIFFQSKEPGLRSHPGIEGGHFFKNGLKAAEEEIQQHLLNGIGDSMRELGRQFGWEVRPL